MIRIQNLNHAYGATPILSDVSLDIPRGGITALVGANGAGKSTLLSLIARLIPIQSGKITVDDLEVGKCPTDVLARKLSILPQSSEVAPRLTVKELVGFGRYPHHKGRPNAQDHQKVEDAIAAFDLQGFVDRPLDMLSGGQRQRAQIAMTYAQDTEYLLLDEPLNNLDIAASRGLMKLLQKLAHEHNRTIITVLHDINYACGYADHMITLVDTRLHATGTPQKIVDSALMRAVFGTDAQVHQIDGQPVVRV